MPIFKKRSSPVRVRSSYPPRQERQRVGDGERQWAPERFAVGGADEQTEVLGAAGDGATELGRGDLRRDWRDFAGRLAAGTRLVQLRLIGVERALLCLPCGRHVDDERWREGIVLHVREDGGRPVRPAAAAALEAGVEAGVGDEAVRAAVVGVAV